MGHFFPQVFVTKKQGWATFWAIFPQTHLVTLPPMNRDSCYDFLNIFAEKFSEKMGVFHSK
jgi:hypothetical protein